MHESLNEFKFLPDTIEKLIYNVVTTLALSFLIRSFSFLQVKRTTIKLG